MYFFKRSVSMEIVRKIQVSTLWCYWLYGMGRGREVVLGWFDGLEGGVNGGRGGSPSWMEIFVMRNHEVKG